MSKSKQRLRKNIMAKKKEMDHTQNLVDGFPCQLHRRGDDRVRLPVWAGPTMTPPFMVITRSDVAKSNSSGSRPGYGSGRGCSSVSSTRRAWGRRAATAALCWPMAFHASVAPPHRGRSCLDSVLWIAVSLKPDAPELGAGFNKKVIT